METILVDPTKRFRHMTVAELLLKGLIVYRVVTGRDCNEFTYVGTGKSRCCNQYSFSRQELDAASNREGHILVIQSDMSCALLGHLDQELLIDLSANPSVAYAEHVIYRTRFRDSCKSTFFDLLEEVNAPGLEDWIKAGRL